MKAALLAFVLAVTGPVHLRFAVLGIPVSLPVAWLVLAAEVLAVAGTAWLVVRRLRGFRPPLFVVAGRMS